MTFLVYLNHYNIRQCKAQYLSVLYEILGKNLDAHFILTEEYLENYENKGRWEVNWAKDCWGDYESLLKKLTPDKYTLISPAEKLISKDIRVPSAILKEVVQKGSFDQQRILGEIINKKDVTAGLTWVNNKCFSSILKEAGIPTIHHEMGPFRPETYIPTTYFDFSGVNGDTEFNERFKEFLNIVNEVPILSKKELIKVLSPIHYKELITILEDPSYIYEAGAGMQVEVDTNVLLFNNGYNWIDPVLMAEAENEGKILVRPHPSAGYTLTPLDTRIVVDDLKKNKPYDFIKACKKVYCLNSSIGIEALLLGREAVILGDSPFKAVCNMESDLQLKALNFIVFGYLVHRDLIFNSDYYSFRLKNRGNEKLIYLDNMERLLDKYFTERK